MNRGVSSRSPSRPSGLGRAIASALGAAGAAVALAVRSRPDLHDTAQAITSLGGRAPVVRADVSIFSDVGGNCADGRALGGLDILRKHGAAE